MKICHKLRTNVCKAEKDMIHCNSDETKEIGYTKG